MNTYLVKGSLAGEGGSTYMAAKGLRLLLVWLLLRGFRGVVVKEAVDLQALHVMEC